MLTNPVESSFQKIHILRQRLRFARLRLFPDGGNLGTLDMPEVWSAILAQLADLK